MQTRQEFEKQIPKGKRIYFRDIMGVVMVADEMDDYDDAEYFEE